jgi:ABC-type nitrate/sulfonate/bicarbonate transport system substrate-binding protein
VDHIQFPYRSSSHLALMHVVNECGAWDRQRLSVDYAKEISRGDAHKLVPTGQVEFTSGNHVSTYAARVRGDNWVYLGQSISSNRMALVTRDDAGIDKVADIKGKKFGTKGRHPGLNDWLYLKQSGLDEDREEFDMIRFGSFSNDARRQKMDLIEALKTKEVDAAFMSMPKSEFAKREGLKVIDIAPQPMVFYTTVSSSLPFVQKHPDVVKRVLMGLIDGVAFFKTQREKTIQILLDKHDTEGKLDRATAEKLYDDLAPQFEPKLYPSLEAVFNVYEEAKRQSAEAEKIHPLALWDFHLLREIDDAGYIDDVYKKYTGKPLGVVARAEG